MAKSTIADHLIDLVLRPRHVILKDQAAKSRHVAQLRRDIKRKRARPMHMLVALAFEDVDNTRIPIGEITRPFEQFVALLQQRRKEIEGPHISAPSLLPVQIRESRAQLAMDEVQLRVAADPNDTKALEDLQRASAAYDEAQKALMEAVEQRLAALQSAQAHEKARE